MGTHHWTSAVPNDNRRNSIINQKEYFPAPAWAATVSGSGCWVLARAVRCGRWPTATADGRAADAEVGSVCLVEGAEP